MIPLHHTASTTRHLKKQLERSQEPYQPSLESRPFLDTKLLPTSPTFPKNQRPDQFPPKPQPQTYADRRASTKHRQRSPLPAAPKTHLISDLTSRKQPQTDATGRFSTPTAISGSGHDAGEWRLMTSESQSPSRPPRSLAGRLRPSYSPLRARTEALTGPRLVTADPRR